MCLENRHYSAYRKKNGGQVLSGRRSWFSLKNPEKEKGNLKNPEKEEGRHRSTRLILPRILRTSPLLLYGTTHARTSTHDHTHPTMSPTHSAISSVVIFFPLFCQTTSRVALSSGYLLYHHDITPSRFMKKNREIQHF